MSCALTDSEKQTFHAINAELDIMNAESALSSAGLIKDYPVSIICLAGFCLRYCFVDPNCATPVRIYCDHDCS